VSHKGANYIIKEAGDEGKVAVDGRQCAVRVSEEKVKATEGLHKLPARGNLPQSKPAPRERQDRRELPDNGYGGGGEGGAGVSAIAGAHKRAPWERDEEPAEGGARPKKVRQSDAQPQAQPRLTKERLDDVWCTYLLTTLQAKKKKEEIVTITRRQDAEPLDKRPITMKELFPKEFWRI
jgi:hypothetical protein